MVYTGEVMIDPDGIFTKEQRDRLLKHIYHRHPDDHVFYSILAHTGRRVSEVLQMRKKDLNFDTREITWHIVKRRRPYAVRIKAKKKLFAIIKEYLRQHSDIDYDDKLFIHKRQWAHWRLRTYCKEIGITEIGGGSKAKPIGKPHCHIFRHSYAYEWINRHAVQGKVSWDTVAVLQEKMCHTSMDTTKCYLKLNRDRFDEYDEKMDDVEDIKEANQDGRSPTTETGDRGVQDTKPKAEEGSVESDSPSDGVVKPVPRDASADGTDNANP